MTVVSLPALDPSDFARFMREVYGYDPYPYQQVLAERLCAGQPVEVLAAPAGLGKTGLVPAWAFALAFQAGDPAARTVPIRLVWVVDRRIIVDAVDQSAARLAEALASAAAGTVTYAVASRLLSLHGCAPGVPALGRTRMRANVEWPKVWLMRPDAAHVVSATVDQAGSRLLLRGYGVSPKMRPVDAALVGFDSLVALDEAHLAQPFSETLDRLRTIQGVSTGLGAANRPPVVMTITATPPSGTGGRALTLEAADMQETGVLARIGAPRPLCLVEEPGDPATALVAQVQELRDSRPEAKSLVVFANTVETARKAFVAVRAAEKKRKAAGATVEMLIGRVRPADAERLRVRVLPAVAAGRVRSDDDKPIIVVCTQTLEVGADVDFDAAVIELPDAAAFVQRCGRVNREGRAGEAPVVVVRSRTDDPVYGPAATQRCWAWLETLATDPEGASTRRLAGLVGVPLAPASREPALGPVLTPERAGALARTNPPPRPDPPVGLLLHGALAGPTVGLLWRVDAKAAASAVEAGAGGVRVRRWLGPVEAEEILEMPLATVARWLRVLHGGRAGGAAETPDLDGLPQPAEPDSGPKDPFLVIRRGQAVIDSRLANGDVVVVAPGDGGADEFGWAPASKEPVADLALASDVLRLTAAGIEAAYGDEGLEAAEAFLEAVADADIGEGEVGDTDIQEVVDALAALPSASDGPNPAVMVGRRPSWDYVPGLGVVARPRWSTKALPSDADCHTALSRRVVSLVEHLEDTGRRAEEIATNLGLPAPLVDVVRLAGLFHDLGKADERQQLIFTNGAAPAAGATLAKSPGVPISGPAYVRLAARVGWPTRARHEHLSALMVEDSPALGSDPVMAELVVHLVGSHHGFGRPLFPVTADDCPPAVSFTLRGDTFTTGEGNAHTDWDAPARFERLVDRYGAWGLAWLESLVRLADWGVSAEYDRQTTRDASGPGPTEGSAT